LYRQQQTLAEALGLADAAAQAGRRADTIPLQTAWDHVAHGRRLLSLNQLDLAHAEFKMALDMDASGFWPNFYVGVCAYRRALYSEALVSFHACVVLYPHTAECFYNRALVWTALEKLDEAVKDYNRALQLDPRLAVAALNRGMLHSTKRNFAAATADLQMALELGAEPAIVHYNRALVALARHDRPAALSHLRQALEHEPGHAQALDLRHRLKRE
jgi:tetratricopeptide (TPR) repeat protein